VLETRAEGPVVGTHFGVSDEAGAVVCLDSHGQEHRIALGDVLSLRVECP
jgi:hypothetical protein